MFFFRCSETFLLFTVLETDETDWDDQFNTSSTNWYSFGFHFCLAERASLHPYALFTQCPSFAHPPRYLCILYLLLCNDLCAFVSPLTAPLCLILTSDFSPLWILCVSSLSSRLRSYVYSPPSLFFLQDGDGWGLWMSGLWEGLRWRPALEGKKWEWEVCVFGRGNIKERKKWGM